MCAIDIETTGLNPTHHEIIQLALIPLDNNLEPRTDVSVFDVKIRPNYIDRVEYKALQVNKMQFNDILEIGVSQEKSFELFEYWFQKLKLGENKRIVPLGHNITQFDMPFIRHWAGEHAYTHYFLGQARDTMLTAAYLNDVSDFAAEQTPFNKLTLRDIANKLDIEVHDASTHDALYDAMLAMKVYKKLLTHHFVRV
jgi:DNA polymerase III epsilon subunit-like protein